MTARRAAALATTSTVLSAAAVVLLFTGTSGPPQSPAAAVRGAQPAAARSSAIAPRGVVVGCRRRSEARFPAGFTDPRNLVVGPLVLVGGTFTPADVVREFGGNKFPLLVRAGHTVTVRIARRARGTAGLAYGGLGRRPLPQGRKLGLRDAAHTMTFRACPPGVPAQEYRPDGPSGSDADGEPVTFWSGFVLARRPACVPLRVGDGRARPVGLALGRRC